MKLIIRKFITYSEYYQHIPSHVVSQANKLYFQTNLPFLKLKLYLILVNIIIC